MRTIVTGACGFVGRYLVRELVTHGYEVLATDRYNEPPPCIIGEIETGGEGGIRRVAIDGTAPPLLLPEGILYRECNLLDAEAVAALVGGWHPQAIVHLAAQSSAGASFRDPRGTLETNIFCTLNLLEAIRACEGVDRPVRFLSVCSSEEYGRRSLEEMPLGEDSPIEPASPYAVSKAAQGMLSLQYGLTHGVEVIVTRSFGHTGPGQTDRFVLPAFAKQCAAIKAGVTAPVVKVGNLDVVRDFLDVRDVVRSYRALLERGANGVVYNVCSGDGLSLGDALDSLIRISGVGIEIMTDPERLRPVDVPVMVGDNTRLRRDTNWEATVPRERMLKDLSEYWEERIVAAVV
jgi:GDP-4-dehydro-6-deoxy-D-mannose reductase